MTFFDEVRYTNGADINGNKILRDTFVSQILVVEVLEKYSMPC
jgi:hypothetical protein